MELVDLLFTVFLSFLLYVLVCAIVLWFLFRYTQLLECVALSLENARLNFTKRNRPKRIFLVRHGESEGNVEKKLYETVPDHALQLTEKGIFESRKAGKYLKEKIENEKVLFFVSPLTRTRQTFREIAKQFDPSNIELREDPRLREQEWGNFQQAEGMATIFQDRNNYSRFYYRFENGESGADVYDRASGFLDTLFREIDRVHNLEEYRFYDNVIIVSHGLLMRLLLMRYFRWSPEYFETVWNPRNGEIWELEKEEGGKYRLVTNIIAGRDKNKGSRVLTNTR